MNRGYAASLALWQGAARTLVPGSATISKHPKLAAQGAYPIYAQSAQGAELTDVDGNRYLDFGSALGAVILGYNDPRVNAAAAEQLKRGILFSLSSPLTIELSRLIAELVPSIERVRLMKNGSDAASAAARIARAVTGRSKIAVCHYHGWHDWCYVSTPLGKGIPPSFRSEVWPLAYGDLSAVRDLISREGPRIAAFFLEPVHLDEPAPEYLGALRDMVHANGSLLVFDEIVTGFRFGKGGAQEFFGVRPDLTCLAKALGNGFPIAAVGGAAQFMDASAEVITSMTYGEEALSLAAAAATLKVLKAEPAAERIWAVGASFKEGFNALSREYGIPIFCRGYPVRMDLEFKSSPCGERMTLKSWFLQETARRGFLFAGHLFINCRHTPADIERALSACREVFQALRKMGRVQAEDLRGAPTMELW